MNLETSLRYLKGAGPGRATRLMSLGLESLGDLIEHYPRAYLDRTHITPLAALKPGSEATSIGLVRATHLRRTRGRMRNVHVLLEDTTGLVECVWFNQPYLEKTFTRGRRILVSGRVELFRRLQFKNPEYELLEEEEVTAGITPVYPLTTGISQKVMRRLVETAFVEAGPELAEFMPPEILDREDLIGWDRAHQSIHRPDSQDELKAARRRIAFQELFDLQLLLAISRRTRQRPRTAPSLKGPGDLLAQLLAGLPFEPTRAQARAIQQIGADLARDIPMQRLLEGDVGCGKTLVALAAALTAVEAGAQVAFMAPTEILATQHARTFAQLCPPLGVSVATLLGGLPAKAADAIRASIRAGETQIALGTHALIQETVGFKKLGLVIVDEQHRFGVLQRARLLSKGETPHTLIMSATPIPRTLALTLFGDLDITVIDEKPVGRVAPKTHLIDERRYDDMLAFIGSELRDGAQAYFVCPLIEASAALDLRAATDLYERLQTAPALAGQRGALLHGRMKSEEKEQVMRAFSEGKVHYLVATTVIEVGIDVAAASLMVIEHPERFGLSQLHQLRGRVGRGRQPAHVFLIRRPVVGPDAHARLQVLVREDDGFQIAEEDLRQRGPGDFFGVKQSGLPALKIADPIGDPALLECAREEAFALSAKFGLEELRDTELWRRLEMRFGERMRLYEVG